MRALHIDDLRPGFVLGQALVDDQGQVLLHQGVRLTQPYIESLRAKGYTQLFIQDDDDVGVDIEEDLTPVVRARATRTLRAAFQDVAKELDSLRGKTSEDMIQVLSSDTVRVLAGPGGPLDQIYDLVSQILDEVLTQSTLAGLTSLKSADARLYEHSIDVCVVAMMIANAIHLPNTRMRQLATGCLLHDIGMVFVDPRQKESRRIRNHTILGYELLRHSDEPDILSPHVAYEHHERQDGTGLPRYLVGSNRIPRIRRGDSPVPSLIGEIAAVANAYDNLLSGTRDRGPVAPDVALGEIGDLAGAHFNQEIVTAFRRVVPVYPKGTRVVLHGEPFNNFLAVVSEVNPSDLARPTVTLVRDGRRKRVRPNEVNTQNYANVTLRIVGL
ncbi:MAG TPA: HD domain-containing protein [Candidatus Hydrogenedentes bacterium]|nr:HD domain-containing protein [Candidatus Hydrogenedentota bacterium]HIJ73048.1 HD domain-containing protein [Candidatus Hydrogenedentota bacterium]